MISWLKTLLADAFYWTDNDLCVQTRSMYGGAPRAAGAIFLFDQGGKVSHFNYFHNDRTAGPSSMRWSQPSAAWIPGHRTVVVEWHVVHRHPRRARRADDAARATDKPAVFVLPGIRGSKLKANGKRKWHLATSSSAPEPEPAPRQAALEDQRDQWRSHVRPAAPAAGTLHVDASDGNGACRRQAARRRHDHGARYRPVSRRRPARTRFSSTPAPIATIRCSCHARRQRSWSGLAPRASFSPPISSARCDRR